MINSYGIGTSPSENCVPRATKCDCLDFEKEIVLMMVRCEKEMLLYIYCHVNILSLQRVTKIQVKLYCKVKKMTQYM